MLAALIWLLVCGPSGAAEYSQPTAPPPWIRTDVQTDPIGPIPVHLYFGSPSGAYLISENRVVGETGDSVQLARAILEALISGPQSNLNRTLPAASRLRAVFIGTDNICTADFNSAIREGHPGGCRGEMLTVYSIVNSLIINIPSIKKIKLLIDGNDIESLAGHINMQIPLPANMLIIR